MSNKTKPFDERDYTIFAVDFDGVLCENDWPRIGRPLTHNIAFVKELRRHGNKVILWTNRERLRLDQAVAWCKEHGLEFDAINDNLPEVIAYYGDNPRKISADYYVDDKAFLMDFETNDSGFDGPGYPQEPITKADLDDAATLNGLFSKNIADRIADGEVDPAYFFEGGQP